MIGIRHLGMQLTLLGERFHGKRHVVDETIWHIVSLRVVDHQSEVALKG